MVGFVIGFRRATNLAFKSATAKSRSEKYFVAPGNKSAGRFVRPVKGKFLSPASKHLKRRKPVNPISFAERRSIPMNAKITSVAFLAMFAFAGAAAAQDKMSTDSMKTDATHGDAMKADHMKADHMKGDAMKPDHMKGDSMKGDMMKTDK
jgi:pentapeptide MXKDX repeat protein